MLTSDKVDDELGALQLGRCSECPCAVPIRAQEVLIGSVWEMGGGGPLSFRLTSASGSSQVSRADYSLSD